MKLTYSDVLIAPKFSTIDSRADVDLSNSIGQKLPIISSNMKDVTESEMARAMASQGAIGALHRFCTLDENVEMFKKSPTETFCSIGIGDEEYQRYLVLKAAGCTRFIIDVANGASQQVVDQYNKLDPNDFIVVGNFGSVQGVDEFLKRASYQPNAIKVGIGSGSICITRMKTGVGWPQFSAIQKISKWLIDNNLEFIKVIADGGVTCPGDVAKALAAGVDLVMLGSMLAGTAEAPGELVMIHI